MPLHSFRANATWPSVSCRQRYDPIRDHAANIRRDEGYNVRQQRRSHYSTSASNEVRPFFRKRHGYCGNHVQNRWQARFQNVMKAFW